MSDLFCPVTILAVRHADAEYDGTTVPGVGDGGRISERGRAQIAELAARLSGRRVSMVYASPMARAWQSGELLAGLLDVPLEPLPGVRELGLGDGAGPDETSAADQDAALHRVDAVFGRWLDGEVSAALPGAETGAQLVARFTDALEGVADRHRGETVVVISHGGVMTLALPTLAGRSAKALAAAAPLGNTAVVEVEGDADGWRMVRWPGAE